MKLYIDNDFKCHVNNDNNNMREINSAFFDDKCKEFIEGYRFIPEGETWIREDGQTFEGEMVSPHMDYNILISYQELYERMLAQQKDMEQALTTLGVDSE